MGKLRVDPEAKLEEELVVDQRVKLLFGILIKVGYNLQRFTAFN